MAIKTYQEAISSLNDLVRQIFKVNPKASRQDFIKAIDDWLNNKSYFDNSKASAEIVNKLIELGRGLDDLPKEALSVSIMDLRKLQLEHRGFFDGTYMRYWEDKLLADSAEYEKLPPLPEPEPEDELTVAIDDFNIAMDDIRNLMSINKEAGLLEFEEEQEYIADEIMRWAKTYFVDHAQENEVLNEFKQGLYYLSGEGLSEENFEFLKHYSGGDLSYFDNILQDVISEIENPQEYQAELEIDTSSDTSAEDLTSEDEVSILTAIEKIDSWTEDEYTINQENILSALGPGVLEVRAKEFSSEDFIDNLKAFVNDYADKLEYENVDEEEFQANILLAINVYLHEYGKANFAKYSEENMNHPVNVAYIDKEEFINLFSNYVDEESLTEYYENYYLDQLVSGVVVAEEAQKAEEAKRAQIAEEAEFASKMEQLEVRRAQPRDSIAPTIRPPERKVEAVKPTSVSTKIDLAEMDKRSAERRKAIEKILEQRRLNEQQLMEQERTDQEREKTAKREVKEQAEEQAKLNKNLQTKKEGVDKKKDERLEREGVAKIKKVVRQERKNEAELAYQKALTDKARKLERSQYEERRNNQKRLRADLISVNEQIKENLKDIERYTENKDEIIKDTGGKTYNDTLQAFRALEATLKKRKASIEYQLAGKVVQTADVIDDVSQTIDALAVAEQQLSDAEKLADASNDTVDTALYQKVGALEERGKSQVDSLRKLVVVFDQFTESDEDDSDPEEVLVEAFEANDVDEDSQDFPLGFEFNEDDLFGVGEIKGGTVEADVVDSNIENIPPVQGQPELSRVARAESGNVNKEPVREKPKPSKYSAEGRVESIEDSRITLDKMKAAWTLLKNEEESPRGIRAVGSFVLNGFKLLGLGLYRTVGLITSAAIATIKLPFAKRELESLSRRVRRIDMLRDKEEKLKKDVTIDSHEREEKLVLLREGIQSHRDKIFQLRDKKETKYRDLYDKKVRASQKTNRTISPTIQSVADKLADAFKKDPEGISHEAILDCERDPRPLLKYVNQQIEEENRNIEAKKQRGENIALDKISHLKAAADELNIMVKNIKPADKMRKKLSSNKMQSSKYGIPIVHMKGKENVERRFLLERDPNDQPRRYKAKELKTGAPLNTKIEREPDKPPTNNPGKKGKK